ncbi:hypothetical protein RRG08_028500 [Elysia crispata]|uniref:C-type lectin domain-containing protein n=1 Tax=Elysia crispata TaxID=231223 RepID=A0AAE0ZIA6_9GAST|nr:hypothetical protein RRG08_028500 [Elysia crispata]
MLLLISLFLTTGLFTASSAKLTCPSGWVSYSKSCYKVYHLSDTSYDDMRFRKADLFCGFRGGMLAEINSENENNFIKSFLANRTDITHGVWIGLRKMWGQFWMWDHSWDDVIFSDWADHQGTQEGLCGGMFRKYKYSWAPEECLPDKEMSCLCEKKLRHSNYWD